MSSVRRPKKEKEVVLTREEKLEEGLKTLLYCIETWQKEKQAKGQDIDDDSWNVKQMLTTLLGHEHYGTAGYGFEFVLKIWLVLEIWKDGRIVPRCVTLTKKRAEVVEDLLKYKYESTEPSKRPIISIEHQRMEHIFGFSMENGKVLKYDGFIDRWK